MSTQIFPSLLAVVTALFWLAVAVVAVLRKDRGRWWQLVAAGAGLLAVLAIVERIAWWLFTSRADFNATVYGLLLSVLSLVGFVGLVLVVVGAFLDRPRSTSPGPSPAGPPPPTTPLPYPER